MEIKNISSGGVKTKWYTPRWIGFEISSHNLSFVIIADDWNYCIKGLFLLTLSIGVVILEKSLVIDYVETNIFFLFILLISIINVMNAYDIIWENVYHIKNRGKEWASLERLIRLVLCLFQAIPIVLIPVMIYCIFFYF